jgi:hypothetical protein
MDRSNDKENVLSQIPTGRNNALVAESDVQAAVQAIHETFRAHERRWETEAAFAGKDSLKPSENQNQPPEDAMGSCTEKENDAILPNAELGAMLHDRAKRLVETVYRVSQVIPDELYNNFVKEYCAEYELSDGDTSDDDNDDNDEADEVDKEEEEDEFSPHELVDHLAQQKVDELRRQVLDRARQIQLKRAAVIQGATRIAREATLRSVAPPAQSTNEAPSSSDRWGDMDPEKVKRQVASMRESMKELQQRLLTSEKKLETQLDQLKSTVAVIERHQLQGGRNPTQKVDELMRTSFRAPHALQDDEIPALDPAERLDEFLRR